MNKKEIILVPYDFTEESECALTHAIGMAKTLHAEIYINHIVDKKSISRIRSEHKSVFDLEADLVNIANEKSTADVPVKSIIKEGDIFHDIPASAEQVGATLIIFGTHGVHGMQHILGAFALKLVTSATTPVIIVQRRSIRNHGYKKIIYPVDENPYSKQKAYAVSEFAKKHGSEVLIFPKHNTDDHFQSYTNGNLRYSEKVLSENGIPFQTFENTKTSSFGKLVVDFAAAQDADIISITTLDSDDRDVGDFFVGSEDIRIINNEAGIPTLCLNAVVSLKVGGLSGVTET